MNKHIKAARLAICELCNDPTIEEHERAFLAGMISHEYHQVINCVEADNRVHDMPSPSMLEKDKQ